MDRLAEIDTLLASYDDTAEEWSAKWMEHQSLLAYRAKVASEIDPCGVHWLLDLRWIAIAVVVLVGLVVVFTRLMR